MNQKEDKQNIVSGNKPWYQHWWGILLAIGGFGLFLPWYFWYKTDWDQNIKIAASVTAFVVWVVFFAISGAQEPAKAPAVTMPQPTPTIPPTKTPEPTTAPEELDLKAEVRIDGSGYTITNKDAVSWKGCELKVNASVLRSDYTHRFAQLAPDTSVSIAFSEFTKGDGERLNVYETKPKDLSIICGDVGGHAASGYFASN